MIAQVYGRIADALLCSQTPTNATIMQVYRTGGWHPQLEALFRALSRAAPNTVAFFANKCLQQVEIDGRFQNPSPIARGRAVTVFLLPETSQVLKVFRQSLGLGAPKLAEFQILVQRSLSHMQQYYGHCEDLLLPSSHHVIMAPVLGLQSVAILQKLVDDPFTDFFLDHSDSELVTLLINHAQLRRQFNEFTEGMRRSLRDGTRCFDMFGRDNLMLTHGPTGTRLAIADIGVYDLAERKKTVPHIYKRIEERHARLFALYESVNQRSSAVLEQ